MTESITEDRIKGICRAMIDKDYETFCPLRHQPIIEKVDGMQKENEKRDDKLSSIHNLAISIMSGIIVMLIVQLINLLSR